MTETRYVSRQEAASKTKSNLAIPYKKATGSGGPRTPTVASRSGQTTEARPLNTGGQGPKPQATAKGTGQPVQDERNVRATRQALQGTGGGIDNSG